MPIPGTGTGPQIGVRGQRNPPTDDIGNLQLEFRLSETPEDGRLD